jgi:hypothetical protein
MLQNYQMRCGFCAQDVVAPAWAAHINAHEVHNFWHCPNCAYVFETVHTRSRFECAEELLAMPIAA